MKQAQQVVTLRIETVEELNRLMEQTGMESIDDLLGAMITLTDAHCLNLKHCGRGIFLKEHWK